MDKIKEIEDIKEITDRDIAEDVLNLQLIMEE